MKILHTSDWHLGQKFLGQTRDLEHRMMLDWLAQLIDNEQVECLLIAGDVFDTGNPPHSAETIYYQFFRKILRTKCRHVVVIGGNHDLPARLNAPRELMEILGIRVVGCARLGGLEDELLELKNDRGETELVVAAVPFLRDRDLETAASGETFSARVERIKKGIADHYLAISKLAEPFFERKTPVVAMGHLTAKGTKPTDEQAKIHLGGLEIMDAAAFDARFGYVALGHIHRPQKLGGSERVRYSGSPIPLSFSEISDEKSVVFFEIDSEKGMTNQRLERVPTFRRLKKLSGTPSDLIEKMERLAREIDLKTELPAWIECTVEAEKTSFGLADDLREAAKKIAGQPLEILKVTLAQKSQLVENERVSSNFEALEELDPMAIFLKRAAAANLPDAEIEELRGAFLELQNWQPTS